MNETLTTKQAAAQIGVSPKTLISWRMRRQGPPYRKLGRKVLYSAAELNRWVKANTITHTR